MRKSVTEIVKAGLVQQRWTGDMESMIANAVDAIGVAASAGAQVVCLQEVVVRDLDMDQLQEVRQLWAFYRDRRPDACGLLTQP